MEQPLDPALARLSAANPIDGGALSDRLDLSGEDLLADIIKGDQSNHDDNHGHDDDVESPRRQPSVVTPIHRRRTWRLAATAAAIAVVLTSAALAGMLPGKNDKAYAITVDGSGVIVVNWMRDLRDGSAIADDLSAYGIDAEVKVEAASPSQVGRVLAVSIDGVEAGQMPPGVSWGADGTDEVFTWSIDPAIFTDAITITLGVEPDPDEPYVYAESAFTPGEVLGGLHCALGEPVTSAQVAKQTTRLGLDVRWVLVEAVADSAGDIADNIEVSKRPQGTVINASPVDDHTILVEVAPPDAPDLPVYTPVRPTTPCTPDLADRWRDVI